MFMANLSNVQQGSARVDVMRILFCGRNDCVGFEERGDVE